jgi:putative phosphoesterase
MRIAALYDIHANLPALEAVVDDVRRAGVDHIVVGGDVVLGPMPRETMDRLLNIDVPVQFIRGNCDREVLASTDDAQPTRASEQYRDAMRWVLEQLPHEHRELISAWPLTLRLTIDQLGDVLFCHATPRNDVDVFTERTAEQQLRPLFDPANAGVVVCGHSHMQFDRKIGATRVVNAGSVGMPFGEPGAYWVVVGPEIELRRTEYDISSAAERIRSTQYPLANNFAAHNVLQPPSAAEMLATFSRAELQ